MRPTKWYVLVAIGLVAGGAAYLVTKSNYNSLPSPHVYSALWLALLALAEGYVAFFTRARLTGRSGTRPIDPLVVARLAALAKASSVVGAAATGVYAGFLGWVARVSSPTATSDTKVAGLGIAAGLLLAGAALFLEWICRVPKDEDDDNT
jgi:hypothetical protein